MESASASNNPSDTDSSINRKGGSSVAQQGQETQMEVDSNSSKSSMKTTSEAGLNQARTSDAQVTPMDVDMSSSSERMSGNKEKGARPKDSQPHITLTEEQEKVLFAVNKLYYAHFKKNGHSKRIRFLAFNFVSIIHHIYRK